MGLCEQVKYKISEDDYVGASMLFSRLSAKVKILFISGFSFLAAVEILTSPKSAAVVISGIMGGGLIFLLFKFVVAPYLSRRQYRQHKSIQDEFTLSLLDEGVRVSSSTGDGIIPWDSIMKWRQNDDYILIYPMPRQYHIVPKSLSDDGFDIENLEKSLRKFVGIAS